LRAIESGGFGAYRHPTYAARDRQGTGSDYLQGAVVVLDAATGEVRALVGGRDFSDSKFDRATQAMRQPGSAFKPFIYAAALERYRSPTHQVEDSPLRLTLSGGRVWEPQNYTGQFDGPMTMREALTRSKNIPTVRLAQEVGIGSAIRMAQNLGISSDIPDVPATALGAADVRPIELIAAYAPFANGGDRVEPHLIRRVVDRNGVVLWEARPRRDRALDPAVAFVMTTMLQDVIDRGTGSAVRSVGFRGPAGGKTGTTNDASDVWFIGYTPGTVAGVWIGLDRPATIVRGASGGTLAAPVWGRMMRRIQSSGESPDGWRPPSGVTTAEVDRATGALVNPNCPAQGPTYTEYFIRSLPPEPFCPIYDYDYGIALGDTVWIDEEWGDFDFDLDYPRDGDTTATPGIDWPELEALRRRIEQTRRELETGQAGDPGTEDPLGDRPDPIGDDLQDRPAGQPPATPPPGDPQAPSGDDADDRDDPPSPPPVLGEPSTPTGTVNP
jgi:penicillin-binding protein 1A